MLGARSARARDEPPCPVTARIVARLDASRLEVELHLRNVRAAPLVLPRSLIAVSGEFHARAHAYPLALMQDSLRIGDIRSRVGPRRPSALSLAPDREGHYATFRGPVPDGLSGRGRGRIQLAASPGAAPLRDRAPIPHRLDELRLQGRVRYAV